MKKIIIENIINKIKKLKKFNNEEILEIEYGLLSIYLTLSKIIIILFISYFLGILKETIIFMIAFNILRTTGFGLHATKSWICLITSICIFIIIPILCKYYEINLYIKLIVSFICGFLLLISCPADTKKRPIINKKRRLFFKIITFLLSFIYILFIYKKIYSNYLFYALIIETILTNKLTYKIFKLPYNNYKNYKL